MAKLAVIRMKGGFSLSPSIRAAFSSLNLGRLYSCALLDDSASSRGMLQSCKDFVSFGPVEKETAALLLVKRGRTIDGRRLSQAKKPEEIKKMLEEFIAGKKLSELGVAPSFCLSPPKGGFGSRKHHQPFGPIGKNLKIAELIGRMA